LVDTFKVDEMGLLYKFKFNHINSDSLGLLCPFDFLFNKTWHKLCSFYFQTGLKNLFINQKIGENIMIKKLIIVISAFMLMFYAYSAFAGMGGGGMGGGGMGGGGGSMGGGSSNHMGNTHYMDTHQGQLQNMGTHQGFQGQQHMNSWDNSKNQHHMNHQNMDNATTNHDTPYYDDMDFKNRQNQ
jgi:hypothetical protein